MRKSLIIFGALLLTACGNDPQALKAGAKVGEFTLLEDAKTFNSMNECIQELQKLNEGYGLTIHHDKAVSEKMHIYAGADSEGSEFMNTCSASNNVYIMRITKK